MLKSYRDPSTEYALPYLLSAGSMVITLLTIRDWSFTVYAFPMYMLAVNIVLAIFAQFPLQQLWQQLQNQLQRRMCPQTIAAARASK